MSLTPSVDIGEPISGITSFLAPRTCVLTKSATTTTSQNVLVVEFVLPSIINPESVKMVPLDNHMGIRFTGQVMLQELENVDDKNKALLATALAKYGQTPEHCFGLLDNAYRIMEKDFIMTILVSHELEPSSKWEQIETLDGMLLIAPFVGVMSKDVELKFKKPKSKGDGPN